jgi:dTDP-4-dehydrorhamnose reductase
VERSPRRRPLEHPIADPLGPGPHGRVLITGAGGQLGSALAEEFPEARALTRADWDVTYPPPRDLGGAGLVLHAAAWTDVDGAEADPQGAAAVNVGGVGNAASLGVPLVAWSTDYVFDGKKTSPYLESDAPAPLGVYGRTKLLGEAAAGEAAWVIRTSWVFGWTSRNFVRTLLRLGAERDEVAVIADQRGCPTYTAHLAGATREVLELPYGTYHVAASGDCTWAEFARAIFEEAGLDTRVREITTAEYGARAARPAYSVLRSERGAPELPHWREGLRECLARLKVD